MEKTIRKDYVEAVKAKNQVSKTTLSLLINEIDKEKKIKKDELTDSEVLSILKKEVKKRNQSIDAYTIGGRTELVEKEELELNVLETYLPKPLSYESLLEIARDLKKQNEGVHEGKLIGLVNKASGGLNKIDEVKRAISEA